MSDQPPQNPYATPEPGAGQPAGEQPASRYGTQSYQPGAYGGPMGEPRQFGLLKTLTMVSFITYLVFSLLGLIPIMTGETEEIMREQLAEQGVTGAQVDQAMSFGMGAAYGMAIAMLLLGAGLYLLVIFGLRARKNWARICGIVFAILALLWVLGSLVASVGTAFSSPLMIASTLLTLAWAAISVYWLLLAFNGDVARYLQQPRA